MFKIDRSIISGNTADVYFVRTIEENSPVDYFGMGSYISGAQPIDFTADLHEIEGKTIAKKVEFLA